MKRASTLFLQTAVFLLGLVVLLLCIFVLPAGLRSENVGGYRPILLGMYVPAIPFYIGMYQTLKLLSYINTGKAFSELSVKALRSIKYCGSIIGALYAIGLPYIFIMADRDDAPGVMLLGLIFTFAPLMIAVFAGVFQKVLQHAIALKSENELTV